MKRRSLFLFLLFAFALLSFPVSVAAQTATDTPTAASPVVAPAPDINAATRAFFARFPVLPAVSTRIGNSSGGTTESANPPLAGRTIRHPDGAPLRTGIPTNADRIGLEWSPDKKTVYVRVHAYWNEGGAQDTYISVDGVVKGFLNDVGFPRQDVENKTPDNAYAFGAGGWMDGIFPPGDNAYRAGLPFTVLRPGPDSGVPGYSWTSTPSGLVIKTPKTTIYGLVGFESAVTDPANANLLFTEFNSYTVNWSSSGNGKEQRTFAPSYDFTRYPTDPRSSVPASTHPGPLAAVRVGAVNGGELYVFSGENDVTVHRWDAASSVLVPVASLFVRPDQMPTAIPGAPTLTWGQGAIARAGTDGNFAADRWQVFNATQPVSLWNGYLYDVDPSGNLYFLPKWTQAKDAGNGAIWQVFDLVRGVFSIDNLRTLVLPDALKTADQCEQIRVDWASGDLVAAVYRNDAWRLERYPKWQGQAPAAQAVITAAYSTDPIALSVRRQYPWYAQYDPAWHVSTDPVAGVPSAGFGSMAVQGGYVFIAEAQAGGVRVHRLRDGAIVGRMADTLHLNSTIDNPTQMKVTQTATEYRVFLLDFHGGAVQVWRVTKKALGKG